LEAGYQLAPLIKLIADILIAAPF